jgi:hypothetical protein
VELPAQLTLDCLNVSIQLCKPANIAMGIPYPGRPPWFYFGIVGLSEGQAKALCQAGYTEEWSDDEGVIPTDPIKEPAWSASSRCDRWQPVRDPNSMYKTTVTPRHDGPWNLTWSLHDRHGNTVRSAEFSMYVKPESH